MPIPATGSNDGSAWNTPIGKLAMRIKPTKPCNGWQCDYWIAEIAAENGEIQTSLNQGNVVLRTQVKLPDNGEQVPSGMSYRFRLLAFSSCLDRPNLVLAAHLPATPLGGLQGAGSLVEVTALISRQMSVDLHGCRREPLTSGRIYVVSLVNLCSGESDSTCLHPW